MKQLKTLHFPNEAEPREIVDAYARERIENLTASSDAPVLDAVYDENTEIITYNNSPAFDEWLTEVEGNEKFAPSGYGLGETLGKYCADCHAVNEVGFYYINNQTLNRPDGVSSGTMMVEKRTGSKGEETYLTIKMGTSEVREIYSAYEASWQGWEWENPPMTLGTEYRTTERWHGYYVYRKVIVFGNLPNNTYKSVTYHDGSWGTVIPVSATGRTSGGQIFPTNNYSGSSGVVNLKVDNNTITVYTNLDLSAQTGYVDVRYIYL